MENSPMELNASRKRSVIVKKRRTSISLEDSFWNSLHAIVQMEKVTIGDFIDKVARQRATPNSALTDSLSADRFKTRSYATRLSSTGC